MADLFSYVVASIQRDCILPPVCLSVAVRVGAIPRLEFGYRDISFLEINSNGKDNAPWNLTDEIYEGFGIYFDGPFWSMPFSNTDPDMHDPESEHNDTTTSVPVPPDYGDTFWRHMRAMRAMPVNCSQSQSPACAFSVYTNFHIAQCRGLQYSINQRAGEISLNNGYGRSTANQTHNSTVFCALAVEIPESEEKDLHIYFLEKTCTMHNYVAVESQSSPGQWAVWTGCERQRLYGVPRPSRVVIIVIVLSDFIVTHKMALKIQAKPSSQHPLFLGLLFDSASTGNQAGFSRNVS